MFSSLTPQLFNSLTQYMKVFEREIRCKRCNRLLMKGEVCVVEIKCPKCGCVLRYNTQCKLKKMEVMREVND